MLSGINNEVIHKNVSKKTKLSGRAYGIDVNSKTIRH